MTAKKKTRRVKRARRKPLTPRWKSPAPDIATTIEPIGGNRELWLQRAVTLMLPWIREVAAVAKTLLKDIPPPNVSCSWPAGRASILPSQTTFDSAKRPHIAISPIMGKGMRSRSPHHEPSIAVCALLLHELIHASVGLNAGHRGKFDEIARALGFTTPIPDAKPLAPLVKRIEDEVLMRIGEYPHTALRRIVGKTGTPGARPQANRQRKYVCSNPNCPQILRAAKDDLEVFHKCGKRGGMHKFTLVDK